MAEYDSGKSHSSSYSRSYSPQTYVSAAEIAREKASEIARIEREVRTSLLSIPDKVRSQLAHYSERELWKYFRRTIYRKYDAETALLFQTSSDTFALGEQVDTTLTLKVATDIHTDWEHLWNITYNNIDAAQRTRPEYYTEQDYSEIEPEEKSETQTSPSSRQTKTEQIHQLLNTGKTYYQKQDYQNAYQSFTELAELEPSSTTVHFHLGISALYIGKYNEAIASLEKLPDSGQNIAQAYYHQGIAHQKLGSLEKARKYYRAASVVMPEAKSALVELEEAIFHQRFKSFAPAKEEKIETQPSQQNKTTTPENKTQSQSSKPSRQSESQKPDTTFNQSGKPSPSQLISTADTASHNSLKANKFVDNPVKTANKSAKSNVSANRDNSPGIVIVNGTDVAVPGTKIAYGVDLGAQYLDAVNQIKSDPNLSPEQKQEEIGKILTAAAAVGGLMVLGAAGGGKTKKSADADVDTFSNNRTRGDVADTGKTDTATELDSTPKTQKTTETATPTSNNLTPDSPLVRALPQDLRDKVRIVVDGSLTDGTVRAYYKPEVYIKVGKNATAADIELHVPTVRTLQRYQGLTGKVRALIERISNWIKRNGEPPVGTLAWEAKLELEKLPGIIEARQARLASAEIDADTRAQLEAEIADLEKQIEYHTRNLDGMDTNPGRGYVAVELNSDSANALSRIEQHTNNLESILSSIEDPEQVAQLSTQIEAIKLQNAKLVAAKNQQTLSPEQIKTETESLIQQLDLINAKAITASQSGLNQTNTGLGSNALGEYKQWQQDLIDLEQIIASDPQLKEQYTPQLRQQQLEWASVPDGDPELWYSMIRDIARPELASTFNQAAEELIKRKTQSLDRINQTLSHIAQQVKNRADNLTRSRGLSYGDGVTQAQQEANRNYPELTQLRTEKTQLENDLEGIEAKKRRIAGQKATERFTDDLTPQDAWERLKQNHDSGGESSSSKLASVLVNQGVINNESEIVSFFQTLEIKGKTLDSVRQQFKSKYRPELLKLIDSQPPELRYQKMREIAESLDVREQGEFSEYWYQTEVAQSRDVPNSTQVTLDKTKAESEHGIELTTPKNRRFDEVYGDENSATIREHKHIRGKLGDREIAQFKDNIEIVQHNQKIANKEAQGVGLSNGKEDNPVILEKDGNKYRPKRLMYTFATPEGVKANVRWINAQVRSYDRFLSFEIVNSKGEIKTIDAKNINELKEPVLSQWLYHSSVNNSQTNP